MTLTLDQQVVWWQGPRAGRLTAVHGAVLTLRGDKAEVLLADGGRRWVALERLQPIRRWHLSWPSSEHLRWEAPLSAWGPCTLYLEIYEDLFPHRCVYEFLGGQRLRYDRAHWCDQYGSLTTLAYCRFRWREIWGSDADISPLQFEDRWRLAGLPNEAIDQLDRRLPIELSGVTPWTRRPIQIGR